MTQPSIHFPLSEFYAELTLPLPGFERLNPSEMPEPFRSLLVHERDMTPTLEAAHGARIHLQVLKYEATEDVVKRLVVLVLDETEMPVEVGAIQIFLKTLPEAARQSVLELREPFGTILKTHNVTHRCRPVAYFRVAADSMLTAALRLNGAGALYGRRNTIWNAAGDVLAEVVEILPPASNIKLETHRA